MKAYNLLILALVLSTSCNQKENLVTEPSQKEKVIVDSIGNIVSVTLKKNLVKKLSKAIEEHGLIYATEFCKGEALPLTNGVESQFSYEPDLKRTSLKVRNPQNAPDKYEKQALDYYQKKFMDETIFLSSYIQKITEKEASWFYYYEPLVINSLCLNCHGDQGKLDSDLAEVLNELYPEDQALGYKEGDFRGLIRVKLSFSD